MANPEHVDIVKQGVKVIKQWREDNPEISLNLRSANLSDANLRSANLHSANLSDADLSGANLSDADLSGANLSDADLSNANLSGADLSNANLSGADLSDADLSGANLSNANLRYANLRYANAQATKSYLTEIIENTNTATGETIVVNNGTLTKEYKSSYVDRDASKSTVDMTLVPYRTPIEELSANLEEKKRQLHEEIRQFEELKIKLESGDAEHSNEKTIRYSEATLIHHNYLNHFLLPLKDGVVTAVYKDIGEYVAPGEPVIRIEDWKILLIVGRIQHRGFLSVGNNVKITTKLYDSDDALTFDGKLVSVRGHQSDDDEWDIVIESKNPVNNQGNTVIPNTYSFDRDTTLLFE